MNNKNLQTFLFTQDHEWVRVENNIAWIGITKFAQKELGDIVHIEIEEKEVFNEGEIFGYIDAVKTTADLCAPLHMEIIEKNESLKEQPEKINDDPFGEGWILKVKMKGKLQGLMNYEEYKKLTDEKI